MKNHSSLRFCIIGGRGFGKSVLVSSLIRLAGMTEGNVVPVGASQKGIRKMQAILSNGDSIDATSWSDVKDFRFRISQNDVDAGTKEWQVSFVDYPGELFQKVLPTSGRDDAEKNGDDNDIVMDQDSAKIASKLFTQLKTADGLIILLPSDIEREEYRKVLVNYQASLGDFLKEVIDGRPNLPVCLAFNKWDMVEGAKTPDELLAKPIFGKINNIVKNSCPNFSRMAISAFGGHDAEDKGKWDRQSEPTNVLEMLFDLATRADTNRMKELEEGWTKAGFLSKCIVWPFKAAHACIKSFSATEQREKSSAIRRNAVGRLAMSAVCIALASTGCILVRNFIAEKVRFAAISSELKGFEGNRFGDLRKENIENLHSNIVFTAYPKTDRMFFGTCKNKLSRRLNSLENRFNDSVYSDLTNRLASDVYINQSPWDASRDDREARSKSRTNLVSTAMARVTEKAIKAPYHELIQRESVFRDELATYSNFNARLYNDLRRPDGTEETEWTHQLPRKIKNIQDQFAESGYDSLRSNDWSKLCAKLAEAENTSSNELASALAAIDNRYLGSDWGTIVAITDEKTNEVSRAQEWFTEQSEVFVYFASLRDEWAATNSFWRHFGPFDDDLAELNRKPTKGKIHEIDDFLGKHPREAFPERLSRFTELDAERGKLIQAAMEAWQKEISENEDDKNADYARRTLLATKRIEACDKALAKLPTSGNEHENVVKLKDQAENFKKEHAKDVDFENLADEQLRQGTIRSISEVLYEGEWKEQEAFVNLKAAKLEDKLKELIIDRTNRLEKALAVNRDDPRLKMQPRIGAANNRIDCYATATNDFYVTSVEYKDAVRHIDEERLWIESHKKYQEYDSDEDGLPVGHPRIRAIEAFLKKHSADQYHEYTNRIGILKTELERLVKDEKDGLTNSIAASRRDFAQYSWQSRVAEASNRIEKINRTRDVLPQGESQWLDGLVQKEESDIKAWTRDGRFDDAFRSVIESSDTNNWLLAIAEFESQYRKDDYPDKTNEFAKLASNKTVAVSFLRTEYNSEHHTLVEGDRKPDADDFEQWRDAYSSLRYKAEDLENRCPSNSDIRARFAGFVNTNGRQEAKYSQWVRVKNSAKEIKNSSTNDEARLVLPQITAFLDDYSRTNELFAATELDQYYDDIATIQDKYERKLAEELNDDLSQSGDMPVGEDERRGYLRQKVDKINEYLDLFVPQSSFAKSYKHQREMLVKQQRDEDRISSLVKAAQDVMTAASQQGDPAVKYSMLDNFLSRNESTSVSDSEVTTLFTKIEELRDDAKREKEWYNIYGDIPKQMLDTDKPDELKSFKAKCKRKIAELMGCNDERAPGEIRRLKEYVSAVEKRIGTGSYQGIVDNFQSYKRNPTKEQYEELVSLLTAFDRDAPENVTKVADVNEISRTVKEDHDRLMDLIDKLDGFAKQKSRNTFIDFKNAYITMETNNPRDKPNDRIQHPQLDLCKVYFEKTVPQSNFSVIPVSCTQIRFHNSEGKKNWKVKIMAGKQTFYNKKVDSAKHAKKVRDIGLSPEKSSIDFIPDSSSGVLFVANMDEDGSWKHDHWKGEKEIDYYWMLGAGIKSGTCDFKIELKDKNDKLTQSYFLLTIAGIPTITLRWE